MNKALIVDLSASITDTLLATFVDEGYHLRLLQSLTGLRYQLHSFQPDILVILVSKADAELADSLQRVNADIPIVVFAERNNPPLLKSLLNAGVSSFVVAGLEQSRLGVILQTAIYRHQQYAGLQSEVVRLQGQLESRKLIEKAKGIIMSKKRLDEDEAYQQLRHVAMKSNKKMTEVAQYIISSADLFL